MVPETDLENGQLRLLDVDNRVVVPIDTHIRFIVTGADVIHDFAVPSLGLKIDAVPGRLNQTSVLIEREGVFYGQGSEICGVYHGFMPIAVEAVTPEKYLAWIDSQASPLLIAPVDIKTGSSVINSDNIGNSNNKYIEWVDTKGMKSCRKVLRSMFDHFPVDHPLNKFISGNLNHTFVEPTGHTSILYSDVMADALNSKTSTFTLNSTFTPSQFTNSSGVYIVYNPDGSESYVGSATDFCKRWANHYNGMYKDTQLKVHKYMLENGPTSLNWSCVIETPDYLKQFYKEYGTSVSAQDYQVQHVLRTFTQYVARSYEQAIISAIEPSLNSNQEVIFTSKWDPDVIPTDNLGSKAIKALGKVSGEEYHFNSLKQASSILDINTRSINNLLNYPNHTLFSSSLGESFSFMDLSGNINEGSPHVSNTSLPFPGVDHSIIPMGEVWALDQNLNRVATFNSSSEASDICGVSKKTVLHNINRIYTKCTVGGTAMLLLFVRNFATPVKSGYPVIVVDTINNIAYYYTTLISAMRALDVPASFRTTNIRSRYIDTGKLLRKRWALFLDSDYEGTSVPGPTILTENENKPKSVKPGKGIILVDTLLNTETEFSSISALLEHIGVNPRATSFVKRYMNPTTLYKGRFEFRMKE